MGTVNQLWWLVETEPIPLENSTAKQSLWLIRFDHAFYLKKSISHLSRLLGTPNALRFQIILLLFQMHTKNLKHEGIPWAARTFLSQKGPVETLSWLNLSPFLGCLTGQKALETENSNRPEANTMHVIHYLGWKCQRAAGITLQTSHLSSAFSQRGSGRGHRFRDSHKRVHWPEWKKKTRRKTEWICILSHELCNRKQTTGQQQIRTGSSSLFLSQCNDTVQPRPVGRACTALW